jgi:hypothetical protein
MDIHLHQVKDYSRDAEVDNDTQKEDAEVFEISVDQENEYDQDQN